MKIEKIAIDKLLLDPANARKHGQKNLDSIKGSLAKFGQQKPIVVNADNVIVAGNGTMQAAKELGWKEINIVRTDLKGSDITAFGIADNRTSELAEWDDKVLSELLEGLKAEDFDLSAIGFDIDDMNEMIGDKNKAGLTDPDEVPEPPEVPTAKLGDIWQLGNHRLMCGDSTDIDQVRLLLSGNKVDLLFTDPPYNVAFNGRSGKHDVIKNDNLSDSDFANFIEKTITTIKAVNPSVYYIWCNWKFYGLLQGRLDYKACIVWAKNVFGLGNGYRHQHEFCLFNGKIDEQVKNESDLWEIKKDSNYVHPTQKPVALSVRAFSNHIKLLRVLDLFGGSGSTLIGAEQTGRLAHVMELDPIYCDVIIKRWEDFTGKKAVLINEN